MVYAIRDKTHPTTLLTDDAEDAQDVGGEDDQQVDEGEEHHCDGGVPQPVEGLGGEQHLLDGSPHLRTRRFA